MDERTRLEIDVINAIVSLAEYMGYPDGFALPVPDTSHYVCWGTAEFLVRTMSEPRLVLVTEGGRDVVANDARVADGDGDDVGS